MRRQPRLQRVRQFIATQLRMTSTRAGLIFAVPTAAGYVLDAAQQDRLMAAAGIAAALYGLIFPDRQKDD